MGTQTKSKQLNVVINYNLAYCSQIIWKIKKCSDSKYLNNCIDYLINTISYLKVYRELLIKEDLQKYLIIASGKVSQELLAVSKFLVVSLLQYAALQSQKKYHMESKSTVIDCINLLMETFNSFHKFTNEYSHNQLDFIIIILII